MPLSNADKRKLVFPLTNVLAPEGVSPDDGTPILQFAWSTTDDDERVSITMQLSLNEYVALASAIDAGRDIAFGTDSQWIWWIWSRAFAGGGGIVVDCNDVADCVETELVTNQILINQVTETVNASGFGNPNRVNPYKTTPLDRNASGFLQEDIKALADCNLDALWAGIRHGIVQRMDDTVRDALEDLATIPELSARVSAFIDIIPVVGDVVEALVQTVASVVPTLLNLYNSHSSEATLDEIACDLFSLVCAECRYLTHEEMYDYYKNFALPATPSIADWTLDVMMQLISNPVGVTAKVAYFTLQTWALGILYIQALFNGNNGTRALVQMANLGEDFANNNWFQLCAGCSDAYAQWTWNFGVQGQGDTYVDATTSFAFTGQNNGIFVPGKGWRFVPISTSSGVEIAIPLDPTWKIKAIGIKTDVALTSRTIVLRPTAGTQTGSLALNPSTGNPYNTCIDNIGGTFSGYSELGMALAISNNNQAYYFQEIAIIFEQPFSKPESIPTADTTLCS